MPIASKKKQRAVVSYVCRYWMFCGRTCPFRNIRDEAGMAGPSIGHNGEVIMRPPFTGPNSVYERCIASLIPQGGGEYDMDQQPRFLYAFDIEWHGDALAKEKIDDLTHQRMSDSNTSGVAFDNHGRRRIGYDDAIENRSVLEDVARLGRRGGFRVANPNVIDMAVDRDLAAGA